MVRSPSDTEDVLVNTTERFGQAIERRDGRDFPYYNGDPTSVASWKWVVIVLACLAGFAALLFIPAPNNVWSLIPRILFPAIPMAVFIALVRPHWRAIFHPIAGRDVLTIIVFWLLNLVVSSIVGLIVKALFGANANPVEAGIASGGPLDVVAFYVGTGIQLFGEEVFTILPFLAVMCWLSKAGMSRKSAMILAWFITAAWFGAAHLPTYGWNVAQALLVIGVARLVLTLAYIRTKNILVSTGAHILNDWTEFTLVLAAGIHF
jgi:membrane protease YdiL (CAAX protease family)